MINWLIKFIDPNFTNLSKSKVILLLISSCEWMPFCWIISIIFSHLFLSIRFSLLYIETQTPSIQIYKALQRNERKNRKMEEKKEKETVCFIIFNSVLFCIQNHFVIIIFLAIQRVSFSLFVWSLVLSFSLCFVWFPFSCSPPWIISFFFFFIFSVSLSYFLLSSFMQTLMQHLDALCIFHQACYLFFCCCAFSLSFSSCCCCDLVLFVSSFVQISPTLFTCSFCVFYFANLFICHFVQSAFLLHTWTAVIYKKNTE